MRRVLQFIIVFIRQGCLGAGVYTRVSVQPDIIPNLSIVLVNCLELMSLPKVLSDSNLFYYRVVRLLSALRFAMQDFIVGDALEMLK